LNTPTASVTWLAVDRRVSASTQNQALSALLFLYTHVLAIEIPAIPPVVRARTPERLPVVLSREEVDAILAHLAGVAHLCVMRLYGTGLRLEECLTLRVQDVDFDRHQIIVRQGKGQTDRTTMRPASARESLAKHLADVRRRHARDLAAGLRSRRIAVCIGPQVAQSPGRMVVAVRVSGDADLPRSPIRAAVTVPPA
jgi:integrase